MKYYAIMRKRDKKLISGSDFRYNPPHCILANEWRPPLLISCADPSCLEVELLRRKINLKYYEVTEVNVVI